MNINDMSKMSMQDAMLKISTGSKINSAKDDASGLAIAEKIQAEISGLEQGIDNTGAMEDLLKTAEGGLSNISDGLQQVRELSIQAANGTLDDSDRALIQNEIDQILQGIGDVASSTQYNNKNLLDGSFQNQNTASYADGTGKSISIDGFSVEALGLANYNVTGNFDVRDIDKALELVNNQRSTIGVTSNGFSYTMNSNSQNSLNLAASRSKIVDTNIPKAVTDMNKATLTEQYKIFMQKKEQEDETKKVNGLLF